MSRSYSHEADVHRVLKLDDDAQRGADVLALQHAVNRRLRARGLDHYLVTEDDGIYGEETALAAHKAVWALGGTLATIKAITVKLTQGSGALSIGAQRMIRYPGRRVEGQLDRARDRRDDIEKAAANAHASSSIRISGNTVTGGTPSERLKAAAEHAAWLDSLGRRRSFYSQPGAWTVRYGITGEPSGFRSDCSQWVTSIYFACGLPDPNGNGYQGGYTGTLGSNGRPVSRADLRPGDLILYGPAPHHHVEMYVGPGQKTIGHGSRPVDAGWIDLAPDPHFRRYV